MTSKKSNQLFQSTKNIKKSGFEELTAREIEVLQSISEGLAAKNIADKLFVSIDTIRYHTKNIYKKVSLTQ